ncbi:LysR family transcriptional regulator [Paenibacillus sp. FSL R7-0302]|uniref:LysR family transcriptional regulator n=1 Tax=Paenibacillus sp. FSL R7-0302 TaxID=2921681 RepID=UPI0030FBECEA
MELTYLRTFCAVVDHGSYTRAADVLGYAQPSVTAQIAKLEEMYGATLLERSGRGMIPTFAGRNLLPYARQMLVLSEEAKKVITGGDQGTLNIGAIETLAAYFLPHRLHQYRMRYPGMQLRVQPGSEEDIIAAVLEKSVQFGLIFDVPFHTGDLITLPLREEALYVVTHPEHLLAAGTEVTAEQLEGEPLVLTEHTCTYRKQLLQVFRESGVAAHIGMEFGNLEGIKQAVKHNWGTGFLPRYAVEEELRTGALTGIPLAGQKENFYIQLIYRKEQQLSPAFTDFIALMQEQYN